MNPLAEMALKLLKDYGLPTLIAVGLWYTLDSELKRNAAALEAGRKEAAEERASHTVILIDQLSALRLACKPDK